MNEYTINTKPSLFTVITHTLKRKLNKVYITCLIYAYKLYCNTGQN